MFKQLKEEMLMIPVLMVLVEIMRQLIMKYNPMAGVFIPETELLVFAVKFWQFLWITSGVWVLLRIVFPKVYKHLVSQLYFSFDEYDNDSKSKVSLYFFGLFLIGFILLFNGAKGQGIVNTEARSTQSNTESFLRKRLCDTLAKQLYVRELTGNNDGVEVERYLRCVGLGKGYSWCAAYVSYNYVSYNIVSPKSARAAAFSNLKFKIYDLKLVKPGDVFTLYYPNLGRVGHVGFIVGKSHGYYVTNEGNTGSGGVREGSGVHSYLRNPQTIYQINNYITLKFINNENIKKFTTNYSMFNNSAGLQNQAISNQRKGNGSTEGQRVYKCEGIIQGFYNIDCSGFYNIGSGNRYYQTAKNIASIERKQACAYFGSTDGKQTKRALYLQGFRIASETFAEVNRKLQVVVINQSSYTHRNKNHNKERNVHTQMAALACSCGRCNLIAITNISNKKNNHCWDA